MTNLMLAALAATFSFGEVKVDCPQPGDWKVDLVRETAADGAEIAKIVLDAPAPAKPPVFTVAFALPQVDIDSRWSVNDGNFGLPPNWGGTLFSEFARNMPLYVFLDGGDTSRLALAASEASRHVRFRGGVREEGSLVDCAFTYFDAVEAPLRRYETRVRFDARPKYFGDAVRESVAWFEKTAGYVPCRAPEAAFDPAATPTAATGRSRAAASPTCARTCGRRMRSA